MLVSKLTSSSTDTTILHFTFFEGFSDIFFHRRSSRSNERDFSIIILVANFVGTHFFQMRIQHYACRCLSWQSVHTMSMWFFILPLICQWVITLSVCNLSINTYRVTQRWCKCVTLLRKILINVFLFRPRHQSTMSRHMFMYVTQIFVLSLYRLNDYLSLYNQLNYDDERKQKNKKCFE